MLLTFRGVKLDYNNSIYYNPAHEMQTRKADHQTLQLMPMQAIKAVQGGQSATDLAKAYGTCRIPRCRLQQ